MTLEKNISHLFIDEFTTSMMNNVNITIKIHYRAYSKGAKHGSFESKGQKPEIVAYHRWNQIKKKMSYHAEIEKSNCIW